MLSKESLDFYRRMTSGQRLALTLEAMRDATPYLLQGPDDIIDRRFAWIREQNNERNRRMLEGLAREIRDEGA